MRKRYVTIANPHCASVFHQKGTFGEVRLVSVKAVNQQEKLAKLKKLYANESE